MQGDHAGHVTKCVKLEETVELVSKALLKWLITMGRKMSLQLKTTVVEILSFLLNLPN